MTYPELDGTEPCRSTDPDAYFPEAGNEVSVKIPAALCTTCHVQAACALWGLHHERFGIWGGTTARERWVIRRRLGIDCNELVDFGLPRPYTRKDAA